MIDILIIFNSATYNDDFDVVSDRATITENYLKGWFLIDLVSIIPFDLFVESNGETANLVRFVRIGRITKMLKLMKLMRLMKLQKQTSFSLLTWIQDSFHISPDFRWFFRFICYFTMTTHIVACAWIIAGHMDPNREDSWIAQAPYTDFDRRELYLTSFYFTVTTITTVGYGDMSASTFTEQILCIFIMLAGVIAFSLASGALTNYISTQERKSEKYEVKMSILESIFQDAQQTEKDEKK